MTHDRDGNAERIRRQERRRVIKTLHPDVGGDNHEFIEALAAVDIADNETNIVVLRPRSKKHKFWKLLRRTARRRKYIVLH